MRKYIVLLLFIGGCLFTFAQTQKVVHIAKEENKAARSVKKFVWKGDPYLFKGDSIYRLPFSVLRQRVEPPLRGEIVATGDGFAIKGHNVFPDVVCFAKGMVVRADAAWIVVDHGNGFESCYGNVLSPRVQVGRKVAKGQLMGRLSQDKELLFGLRLQNTPIDVKEVFNPQTGLDTYVGNLYIYNRKDSVFVSRHAPMVQLLQNKDAANQEFIYYYKKGISDHRAKRDFVDETIQNATNEEINLEDVQIGPAKKQDTVRVKNTIVL